jgi:hypothetical protein
MGMGQSQSFVSCLWISPTTVFLNHSLNLPLLSPALRYQSLVKVTDIVLCFVRERCRHRLSTLFSWKSWSTPTSRTIYQWSKASKNKSDVNTTKQTAWTQAVRKGKGNTSAEGQELLEDKEIWKNETALHGSVYESRQRERSNEDGLFMPHQKGPITSTFTADWFLREGQGRELLGEWMKLTSVRSQDQRRTPRANSHTFPTNAWIHKITKGKNPTDATYVGPSG